MAWQLGLYSDDNHASLIQSVQTKLSDTGIATVNSGHCLDYYVYLGSMNADVAHRVNQMTYEHKHPLVVIYAAHSTIHLGPVIIPDETPCIACWGEQQNTFLNNGYTMIEESRNKASGVIVAQYIADYINGDMRLLTPGYLTEIDYRNNSIQRRYRMVKSPRCAVCSPLVSHAAESYRSYFS